SYTTPFSFLSAFRSRSKNSLWATPRTMASYCFVFLFFCNCGAIDFGFRKICAAVDAVLVLHLGWVGPWIVDGYFDTVILQGTNYVHNLGVTHIWAVFFEGDSQHEYFGFGDIDSLFDHGLDDLRSHILSHAIVEATAGQDDFGMVAMLLCFLSQVVKIYSDTVSTDQPRFKRQEIPFGACRFQHGMGIDIEDIKDLRQLVDKGNVDIALGVFNNFSGFSDFDCRSQVRTCRDDRLVHRIYLFTDFGGRARCYF